MKTIEQDLIARAHTLLERMLADAGEPVDPEIVQLQHDIVEYDRAGTGEHFTIEAYWDSIKQR